MQTLAGLSHTGEGPTALDEALRGFERRGEFDFHAFYRCTDPETARALAEAAQALGRKEQAAELLSRAR